MRELPGAAPFSAAHGKDNYRHSKINYWLLLSGALLVLAWMPSDGAGFSVCPFQTLFGIPGPGCGLTRSISSALHFEFLKSFHYHPLGLPLLISALALSVRRDPASMIVSLTQSADQRRLVPALALAFLAVWFLRLGAALIWGVPYFG